MPNKSPLPDRDHLLQFETTSFLPRRRQDINVERRDRKTKSQQYRLQPIGGEGVHIDADDICRCGGRQVRAIRRVRM